MELESFIKNFAAQFEDINASALQADTKFRELDGWSSLVALSIMAMVDEEYNATLKGDEIRNSHTISDIYNIVQQKI